MSETKQRFQSGFMNYLELSHYMLYRIKGLRTTQPSRRLNFTPSKVQEKYYFLLKTSNVWECNPLVTVWYKKEDYTVFTGYQNPVIWMPSQLFLRKVIGNVCTEEMCFLLNIQCCQSWNHLECIWSKSENNFLLSQSPLLLEPIKTP